MKLNPLLFKLLLIPFLLTSFYDSIAQVDTKEESPPKPFWFNVGIGLSSSDNNNDASLLPAAGGSLNYKIGIHLLIARILHHFSIYLSEGGAKNSESISDFSFLYGIAHRGEIIHTSLATGVGFSSGSQTKTPLGLGARYHKTTQISHISYNFDLQFYARIGDQARIGLNGFVSINPVTAYGGALLSLQIQLKKTSYNAQ